MVRNYKRKTTRVYRYEGYYTKAAKAERKANPVPRGRPRLAPDMSTDLVYQAWKNARPPDVDVYLPRTQFLSLK